MYSNLLSGATYEIHILITMLPSDLIFLSTFGGRLNINK